MKLGNLRSEAKQDRTRVAATVLWEDSDRPTEEIYFETIPPFLEALSCNPHAFVVACVMPAMRHREQRIFVDAEICPDFRNGLRTAMSWIRQ